MKNLKWLWWALIIVLVVAGVGFAGFQLGAAQSANIAGMMPHMFAHARGFDGGIMRDGYGMHSGFFGWGGFPFFFGLVRLAILAGLVWLGYTLFKRSGWRLVNVNQAVGEKQGSE